MRRRSPIRLRSRRRGEYVAPSLGRVTVGELGPAWLERKQGHMKPSGYRSYENAWRVYVEPRWHAANVGDIGHTGVQAWISEPSKGLSASRAITVYSVLAGILAMSPSATRSPTAIRRTVDDLGKRLRRQIAAAEGSEDLQEFIRRTFRGNDVEGTA